MMSTYLGSITIVLKLPFTSAASANGLERYNGFAAAAPGEGGSSEPEESERTIGAGERPVRGVRLRLNEGLQVISRLGNSSTEYEPEEGHELDVYTTLERVFGGETWVGSDVE
jgi:hypothetical protein